MVFPQYFCSSLFKYVVHACQKPTKSTFFQFRTRFRPQYKYYFSFGCCTFEMNTSFYVDSTRNLQFARVIILDLVMNEWFSKTKNTDLKPERVNFTWKYYTLGAKKAWFVQWVFPTQFITSTISSGWILYGLVQKHKINIFFRWNWYNTPIPICLVHSCVTTLEKEKVTSSIWGQLRSGLCSTIEITNLSIIFTALLWNSR